MRVEPAPSACMGLHCERRQECWRYQRYLKEPLIWAAHQMCKVTQWDQNYLYFIELDRGNDKSH